MRALIICLIVVSLFPKPVLAVQSDGEEVFANLLAAANACIREDVTLLPPGSVLILYWECLATADLTIDMRALYLGSYTVTLSPELTAASALTQAAADLLRAMWPSDDSRWRSDVVTLLDLSNSYLANLVVADEVELSPAQQQRQDGNSDLIFAALVVVTTGCLDSMAEVVQRSEGPMPGVEWSFGYCVPLTELAGAQLVGTSRLSSLSSELAIATELTREATTLTTSLFSPEWNKEGANQVLFLSGLAQENVAAWEARKCQEDEHRCPRRFVELLR